MLRLFLLMFDEYLLKMPAVSLDQRLMTVTRLNSYSKTQKLHFKQKQLSVHLSRVLHPPSSFTFKQKQLRYLKIKCADIPSHIFIKIAQNQGKAEFKGKGKTLRVVLPTIFVPYPVKPKVLPLGYCSEPKPDPERVCNIPDCIVNQ